MAEITIDAGDSRDIPFTTKDIDGVLTDADALKVHVTNAQKVKTVDTYGEPDSKITKNSTGDYTFRLSVPYDNDSIGEWYMAIQCLDSDGNSLEVEPLNINVPNIGTL